MADYMIGQVWRYRTRPQDTGSLLRIGDVTTRPDGTPVFHVSLVGIDYGDGSGNDVLAHLPVTREVLDASVTEPDDEQRDFPDVAEGMAEWEAANGGVWTTPIAEIVDATFATVRDGASKPRD